MNYPLYVISKGRADECLTAQFLSTDGVDYRLVVEPQEYDAYAAQFDPDRILVLPFSNLGQGSIPARNWVWDHAISQGSERHWILDDNIRYMLRRWKAMRLPMNSERAFSAMEEFVDRYENIAIGGPNYAMFVPDRERYPPFYHNVRVYSCLLIRNDLEQRWRGRYNEDTDLYLQVIAAKWCTVLFNAFLIQKVATMTMGGGNTDDLYQGDGRLRMARSLERQWPGVVSVQRRWGRPQHVTVRRSKGFDTPLRRKSGATAQDTVTTDEHGMTLQVKQPIKSPYLRKLVKEHGPTVQR